MRRTGRKEIVSKDKKHRNHFAQKRGESIARPTQLKPCVETQASGGSPTTNEKGTGLLAEKEATGPVKDMASNISDDRRENRICRM